MSETEREADQARTEALNQAGIGEVGVQESTRAGAESEPAPESTLDTPVLRLVRDDEEETDESALAGEPTADSDIGVYKFKPAGDDRRKHRRFRVMRPGKVFRRATQQYQSVESRDLSFSGALLSIVTVTPYQVGEIVDLGLAMNKATVMPSKSLLQGVVVRAEAIAQGRQEVAVRYIPSVARAA